MSDPKGPAGAIKPQLQIIPPGHRDREVARALSLGSAKYGPWNWRHNKVELMTYLGSMQRHIAAMIDGQDLDPESGAHHLGHVASGCAIVLDAAHHRTLIDNRPPVRTPLEVPAGPRVRNCLRCGGDGQVEIQSGPHHRECPDCAGSGRRPASTPAPTFPQNVKAPTL